MTERENDTFGENPEVTYGSKKDWRAIGDSLTAEYETWLAKPENANVPKISADEALFELHDHPNAIRAQFDWLNDFIARWEKLVD